MTYNLALYSFEDRDHDGQHDDPKPEEERRALHDIILSVSPDILAVQEIGGRAAWEEFVGELKAGGLDYPFNEYLARREHSRVQANLAVLSRFPIVSRQSHTDDTYTIKETEGISVARGFIDIDIAVRPSYSLRLLVAHLKSKVFHRLGQTEMRRNEARLLHKHVREALKEDPACNLLVAGDLNDTYNSRAVREVLGLSDHQLHDLRPRDHVGDTWTHRQRSQDVYSRIDYILVSEGLLPEVVPSKTRIVRSAGMLTASDHRPLVAVFRAKDKKPSKKEPDKKKR
jgi:endonuclease/exonuclease/phosphatase family metal-dependent hydrolase